LYDNLELLIIFPQLFLQFDNFVEDEDSDDDTPGYVASFGDSMH